MVSEARRWPFVATGACAALFLLEAWEPRAQVDDAFISYRYAANLLAGQGLVFNPGEYVEGFTNLLWTLLVAGGMALGFAPEGVGHALGVGSAVATLLAAHAYSRALLPPSHAAWACLAPWIVWSSASFGLWSVSGMETPLFVAAATLAFAAQAGGQPGRASGWAILATLTRPEGVLVGGAVLAFHLPAAWRAGRRAWTPAAAYVLCLALLTAFRLAYYGSPVPNTFYAKVGGIPVARGLAYLADFLWSGSFLLVIPAAWAVARDRRTWPAAGFIALVCLYVVAIGGDAFPASRFLLPVLALLAGLAVRGVSAAWASSRHLGIVLATSLPATFGWQVSAPTLAPLVVALPAAGVAWALVARRGARRTPALASFACTLVAGSALVALGASRVHPTTGPPWPGSRGERLAVYRAWDEAMRRMAMRRAEVLRGWGTPPRLVAAAGIGALGYHSGLPMLDLVGLTEPTIARSAAERVSGALLLPGHQRSNVDYVLAREPDVIVIRRVGSPEPLPVEAALWGHPRFEREYAWDRTLWAYVRRR